MFFADIHSHMLCGVDDGAASPEMMHKMVDRAYADGVRLLCLTPHFHPGYFGDNRQKAEESFARLQVYVSERYPDLELILGNELRYSPGCGLWLKEGACRTLNGFDLVLVDFESYEKGSQIVCGLNRLMSMGYIPVLAHGERYPNLSLSMVRGLRRNGVHIQITAVSLWGGSGFGAMVRAKRLLRRGYVTLAGSDAHDLKKRPPELTKGYRIAKKLTGETYAYNVFYRNAFKILKNDQEGTEQNDE